MNLNDSIFIIQQNDWKSEITSTTILKPFSCNRFQNKDLFNKGKLYYSKTPIIPVQQLDNSLKRWCHKSLYTIVHQSSSKTLEQILCTTTSVDQQNCDGRTMLIILCRRKYSEFSPKVELLLKYGADRFKKDFRGFSARDYAVKNNMFKTLLLLDLYFPITAQMVQVLLGLYGSTETPLTRFAKSSLYDQNVLILVNCFVTGKSNRAFDQLQEEVQYSKQNNLE